MNRVDSEPRDAGQAQRSRQRTNSADAAGSWPRRLTAEVFGTFALVFVAAGADTMAVISGGEVSVAAKAVAPGLMVAAPR